MPKYKPDELPQLWNILTGDMSFVGSRPDVPGYADLLKGDDRLLLSIKPGLTGAASMVFSNEEELLALQDDPIQRRNPLPRKGAHQKNEGIKELKNEELRNDGKRMSTTPGNEP